MRSTSIGPVTSTPMTIQDYRKACLVTPDMDKTDSNGRNATPTLIDVYKLLLTMCRVMGLTVVMPCELSGPSRWLRALNTGWSVMVFFLMAANFARQTLATLVLVDDPLAPRRQWVMNVAVMMWFLTVVLYAGIFLWDTWGPGSALNEFFSLTVAYDKEYCGSKIIPAGNRFARLLFLVIATLASFFTGLILFNTLGTISSDHRQLFMGFRWPCYNPVNSSIPSRSYATVDASAPIDLCSVLVLLPMTIICFITCVGALLQIGLYREMMQRASQMHDALKEAFDGATSEYSAYGSLKDIRRRFSRLSQCAVALDRNTSKTQGMIVVFLPVSCFVALQIMKIVNDPGADLGELIALGIWAVWLFLAPLAPCACAAQYYETIGEMRDLVHAKAGLSMLCQLSQDDSPKSGERSFICADLMIFIDQLRDGNYGFTILHVIVITKETCLSIFSVYATYLILVAQIG